MAGTEGVYWWNVLVEAGEHGYEKYAVSVVGVGGHDIVLD